MPAALERKTREFFDKCKDVRNLSPEAHTWLNATLDTIQSTASLPFHWPSQDLGCLPRPNALEFKFPDGGLLEEHGSVQVVFSAIDFFFFFADFPDEEPLVLEVDYKPGRMVLINPGDADAAEGLFWLGKVKPNNAQTGANEVRVQWFCTDPERGPQDLSVLPDLVTARWFPMNLLSGKPAYDNIDKDCIEANVLLTSEGVLLRDSQKLTREAVRTWANQPANILNQKSKKAHKKAAQRQSKKTKKKA